MDILNGVRVIECAGEIAGPYCAKLFADAGAEVVKVEPPQGDPFRSRASVSLDEGEDGALFKFLNAGKRSIIGTVDDAHVLDLITTADVFVDALGPGVVDHAASSNARRRSSSSPSLPMASVDRTPTGRRPSSRSRPRAARSRSAAVPINRRCRRAAGCSNGSWGASRPWPRWARSSARAGGGGEIIDCSLLETTHLAASGFADFTTTWRVTHR